MISSKYLAYDCSVTSSIQLMSLSRHIRAGLINGTQKSHLLGQNVIVHVCTLSYFKLFEIIADHIVVCVH